jgi:hypothetical protein
MKKKSWKKFTAFWVLLITLIISRTLSWIDGSQFTILFCVLSAIYFVTQAATDFHEIKISAGLTSISIEENKDEEGGK